ncbi:hypothetical protein JXA32_00080 [Candidatus Sumerlaeota bacterium]|nr:hypothetical protein [Candidatus Sumerlaeota bacterium]
MSALFAQTETSTTSTTPTFRTDITPTHGRLTVDAAKVLREIDHRRLTGTNMAGWSPKEFYDNSAIRQYYRDLGPTVIRIPGGSWGDITWWNGNGVLKDGRFDMPKFSPEPYSEWSAPFGVWDVDYSDYAPGFLAMEGKPFCVDEKTSESWNGNIDVKYMHEFIRDVGCTAMVIVNMGQGTPRDAAEWVRWVQKKSYPVEYWELGNELGGSWEAGHNLPGGKKLNGEIYWHRYQEFATAMKAVDPSIKVGCMDWYEDVLRNCGELVDFVSIHTYPANSADSDEDLFSRAMIPQWDIQPVLSAIRQHQPDRADEIEIGYSEWNMGWPSMHGAQWHALFVGEMFRAGMTFSNQFEMTNLTPAQAEPMRAAHYWGSWMWSRLMGDALLESRLDGAENLSAYATHTEDGVSILVVNRSGDREGQLVMVLENFQAEARGDQVCFTSQEYFWYDDKPDRPRHEKFDTVRWNFGPKIDPMQCGPVFFVKVPPASVIVYRIPETGHSLTVPSEIISIPKEAKKSFLNWRRKAVKYEPIRFEIILPDEEFANAKVQGWVCAYDGKTSEPIYYPYCSLEVTGVAQADRQVVRLQEAAGRFFLRSTGVGEATVAIKSGGNLAAEKTIRFKESIPQLRILWPFEETAVPSCLHSQWALAMDFSVRPNEGVVRVDFDGKNPAETKKQEALVIQSLPDGVAKRNIRGVRLDLKTADNFRCDDPEAKIQIVMQSTQNWWMVLGEIPLAECREWKTHTFLTDNPEYIKAMEDALNVWIVLHAEATVEGALYIDDAALMIR